jgi:hypothetical protein
MPIEQIGEKFPFDFLLLIGISIIILTYLISILKKKAFNKKTETHFRCNKRQNYK